MGRQGKTHRGPGQLAEHLDGLGVAQLAESGKRADPEEVLGEEWRQAEGFVKIVMPTWGDFCRLKPATKPSRGAPGFFSSLFWVLCCAWASFFFFFSLAASGFGRCSHCLFPLFPLFFRAVRPALQCLSALKSYLGAIPAGACGGLVGELHVTREKSRNKAARRHATQKVGPQGILIVLNMKQCSDICICILHRITLMRIRSCQILTRRS